MESCGSGCAEMVARHGHVRRCQWNEKQRGRRQKMGDGRWIVRGLRSVCILNPPRATVAAQSLLTQLLRWEVIGLDA